MIPAKEEKRNDVKNEISAAKEKEGIVTEKEIKSEEKQEATLGDLVGMMGGLMAAFAPPEQGKEIQKQFAEIGDTVGTVLQDVAKAMDTLSEKENSKEIKEEKRTYSFLRS